MNLNGKPLNLKQYVSNFVSFLKHTGKVIIIITALVIGFASGEIYHRYKDKLKINEMQIPKTDKEVSIAINECGEILFIDRSTGQYQIYSDGVGKMFFDLYSSKMISTINQK